MVLESLSRLAVLALALAALWAILLALSRLRRLERVEVKPLLLIYRTGRVIEAGGSERRLYRVLRSFAWLGVPVAVLAAALFYYAVGEAVYYRYFSPEPPADGLQRGVVPLLPGVTIPIDVNLVLIAFSVGVAVLVHEVAHALSAVSLGLRVKDSGLILLAFIPAAFVEIDEESYKRASWSAKARVLTAGILGNVLLAIFSLGALALAPAPQPEAVVIESVDPGTPAERSGLRPGDVVIRVESTEVRDIASFRRALEELGVFDESAEAFFSITLLREGGEVEVTVYKPVGEKRLGVRLAHEYSGLGEALFYALAFLNGVFLINLALAAVNAAPLVVPSPWGSLATDGAQMVRETLSILVGEKNSSIVTSALGLATLLLVISVITLQPLRLVP